MLLIEPQDAYEWSFVAVPAQENAGILKKSTATEVSFTESLKDYMSAGKVSGRALLEYEELVKKAELGDAYIEGLRRDFIRLSLISDGQKAAFTESVAPLLSAGQLKSFIDVYEARIKSAAPAAQLFYGDCENPADDGDFRI